MKKLKSPSVIHGMLVQNTPSQPVAVSSATTMPYYQKTMNVNAWEALTGAERDFIAEAAKMTNDVKLASAVLDPGPPGAAEDNVVLGTGIRLSEVSLSDLENDPTKVAAVSPDKRLVFPIADQSDRNVRGTVVYRIDPRSGDRAYIEASGGGTRLSRAVMAATQLSATRPASTTQPQLLHVTGDGVNEYILVSHAEPGPPEATIITNNKEKFVNTKVNLNKLADTLKKSLADNESPRKR